VRVEEAKCERESLGCPRQGIMMAGPHGAATTGPGGLSIVSVVTKW
jgi:hypothetical protein